MHPVHQSVWPQPTQDAESAHRCIAIALHGLCVLKAMTSPCRGAHVHSFVTAGIAETVYKEQAQQIKSTDAVTCAMTVAAVRAGDPLVLGCHQH